MSKLPPTSLGALLGAGAAGVVVAELLALQLVGRLSADTGPLTPSLVMLAPLLVVGAVGGAGLGLLAGRLRRRRRLWLLLGATASVPLAAAVVMLALSPGALVDEPSAFAALALWATVAYAAFAGPPVVVATLLLERLTRAAPGPGT